MTNMTDTQQLPSFTTVLAGQLRIITSDINTRPMSFVSDGQRQGFEPARTRIVCER